MRSPLIVGNWKLHSPALDLFFNALQLSGHSTVVILPPVPYLQAMQRYTPAITLGAQNVDIHDSGPYTGEISAGMLAACGARYCLVGHSERRQWHGEQSPLLAQKCDVLSRAKIVPILCFGEPAAITETSEAIDYCLQQLQEVLGACKAQDMVLAYEPLGAIGSGAAAHPDEVNARFQALRRRLPSDWAEAPMLYGGSVDERNAHDFLHLEQVNGVLVGGASLDAQRFNAIVGSGAI